MEADFSNNSWFEEEYIASIRSTFTITNKSITANTTPLRESHVIPNNGTISYSYKCSLSGSITNSPYYAIFSFIPLDNCTIKYKDNYNDEKTNDICLDIYDKTSNSITRSGIDDSDSISFKKDHEYLIRVRRRSTSSSFTYSFTFTNEALAEN